jgi:hypothetical protein
MGVGVGDEKSPDDQQQQQHPARSTTTAVVDLDLERNDVPIQVTLGQRDADDESHEEKSAALSGHRKSRLQKIIDFLTWTPPWCRWNPEKPPTFSVWHNVLFAFAGAFTVGNLYYNHPILNILAEDFNVPYVTVSRVPTLMQAGYATGLLFVCPLGDLLKRRPLVLGLILFTATLW